VFGHETVLLKIETNRSIDLFRKSKGFAVKKQGLNRKQAEEQLSNGFYMKY